MRAYRIQFHGYKRLADTSCNVDGPVIAFLGPNEAGKSSVLEALDWLSNSDDEALAGSLLNRGQVADPNEAVVRVHYSLSAEDQAAIADLALDGTTTTFIQARYPGGGLRTGLTPPLSRAAAPFEDALAELANIRQRFGRDLVGNDDLLRAVELLEEACSRVNSAWDPEWNDEFVELVDWLRADDPAIVGGIDVASPRAAKEAQALLNLRDVLQAPHPEAEARSRMLDRAPQFLMFGEEDRRLRHEYNISDEVLRRDPPAGLANLIQVAGLNLSDLWAAVASGDVARARTIERQANRRLQSKLGHRWRQARLGVELNINGMALEILVSEQDNDGALTPIAERSDGLRFFLALAAFLARRELDASPILLIDEIETHLHLDAQADLIEILSSGIGTTQVFYTTHSPGSLPRDLGTGLRFVTPDTTRRSASQLRNDFWTTQAPGFTPLLFAMGAGAAAFSSLRRAVFTEGASDMILLPSLIRLATGLQALQYQIAPGLASYNRPGLELEDAAAHVAYLLDGDGGGDKHKKRLIQDMGIPEDRILQLPLGQTAEDLVDRGCYLATINGLLSDAGNGPQIKPSDLPDSQKPVASAVSEWCEARKVKAPSKIVVAVALVTNRRLPLALSPGSDAALGALNSSLIEILGK